MKIFIILLLSCVFLLDPISIFAKGKGKKGASDKAFEKANENAKFKKEEGWFDKIGKESDKKKETKEDKKEEEKIAKEEEKADEKIEKEEKQTDKKTKKIQEKLEKKLGKDS